MSPRESHLRFDSCGVQVAVPLLFGLASFDPHRSPSWEPRRGRARVTYHSKVQMNTPRRRSEIPRYATDAPEGHAHRDPRLLLGPRKEAGFTPPCRRGGPRCAARPRKRRNQASATFNFPQREKAAWPSSPAATCPQPHDPRPGHPKESLHKR